jgi:hypothetical protein
METDVHRIAALVAVVSSVVVLGGPTQADAVPDLVLTKITTSEATAAVGDRVVFRAYATNRGPGTSYLYVAFSNRKHLAGKRWRSEPKEVCVVPASESGDISEPSADTPQCEFLDVPARDYVVVKVVAHVTGTAGKRAGITFCTNNGGQGQWPTGPDRYPANDCMTTRISITA